MIDLNIWSFDSESFNSAESFCNHISINGRNYQGRIKERLSSDPTYKQWKKDSCFIKDTPFYKLYRQSSESKKFHQNAKTINSNNATTIDHHRYFGLKNEIIKSPVILKAGQILFHGRYFNETELTPYHIDNFLSCSLCPEVAAWHAISKAAQYSSPSNATVFIITLLTDCPAIFGAKGNLVHEQEILLSPSQKLNITSKTIIPTGEFNIVMANLTYSP